MTKEFVEFCIKSGYTKDQAELIGRLDDIFKEAILLNLCTIGNAIDIGRYVGRIFGEHTDTISKEE